ncbi:hypothetical protein AN958_09481, partial [Leucoagaricus sp. SymC.cos]
LLLSSCLTLFPRFLLFFSEPASSYHSSLTALGSFLALYFGISVGPLASIIFVGSLVIGIWGFWAIMFAGSSSVSKTTGADKHTSAFMFGNTSAASSIRKRWKQQT